MHFACVCTLRLRFHLRSLKCLHYHWVEFPSPPTAEIDCGNEFSSSSSFSIESLSSYFTYFSSSFDSKSVSTSFISGNKWEVHFYGKFRLVNVGPLFPEWFRAVGKWCASWLSNIDWSKNERGNREIHARRTTRRESSNYVNGILQLVGINAQLGVFSFLIGDPNIS